jgi:hypothetical protein
MKRAVLVAGVALVLLAAAAPAFADDDRVGVQAVVTETYDSNVAASDAEAAAERGITPQDEITAPSLALNLSLPVSLQELFLKGSAGYDFYDHNRQLDGGQVDLLGGVHARLARCKGTVSGNLTYAQSELQDLSLIATRNLESDEIVSMDGSCGGQIGFAPTFAISGEWSQNSSPELFSSDYDTLNTSLGLAYRQPHFGELSAYVAYNETAFPNRDLLVGPATIQDGYSSYSGGVKYDRHLGARIEGTIKIAYTSVRPDLASTGGYQGLTYDANVTFRVTPRLTAKLDLERAVNPTIRPDVTYALDNSYSLEADYSVSRKIKISAAATGESNRYSGADLIPGFDISSETDWGVNGSVAYQLNRRIGFELDLAHVVRDANVTIFSYTDDRVGLSIKGAL